MTFSLSIFLYYYNRIYKYNQKIFARVLPEDEILSERKHARQVHAPLKARTFTLMSLPRNRSSMSGVS